LLISCFSGEKDSFYLVIRSGSDKKEENRKMVRMGINTGFYTVMRIKSTVFQQVFNKMWIKYLNHLFCVNTVDNMLITLFFRFF